ncbi:MAG: nucleotidyltransferase domain-containing protein [Acidimicrobiales bacterium]
MAGLRLELWKRLRESLAKWKVRPVYACAFGSAARGDGGPDSDIDLLVVHPPFPGEKRPRASRLRDALGAVAMDVTLRVTTDADAARWRGQVDDLHPRVRAWTGNALQVVDISAFQWADRTASPGLFEEIGRDAVVLLEPAPLAALATRSAKAR